MNKNVIFTVLVALPCRMMADLNSPLFTPPQPSMDKKRVLENVENKYREFIAETLRCLIELKRDLCMYYHSYITQWALTLGIFRFFK